MTGTPAGVGPVKAGDIITGKLTPRVQEVRIQSAGLQKPRNSGIYNSSNMWSLTAVLVILAGNWYIFAENYIIGSKLLQISHPSGAL